MRADRLGRASDKTPRLGAVHEPFENDGTVPDSGERARRNRQVVAHQIEFR